MVKCYWWNARPNFGDLLTPLLLKRFTKLDSEWSHPEQSQLVMAGSVMDKLPNDWAGVIAGAGKLHESTIRTFPNAKVLAVRGPLSARGLKGNIVYADAALLADELVPKEDKQYDLGIVPHWSDTELEHNPIFKKYNPLIIRVNEDPLKVIREIGLCKKIVSSSLHGIILSDAMLIPRRIEIAPWFISRPKQEGGIFKWLDYSKSINVKFEVGVTQLAERHTILDKQYELYDVYKEVKAIFKEGN